MNTLLSTTTLCAFVFGVASLGVTDAHAQESTIPQDQILVGDEEISGNSGRVAVNLIAGSNNQQLSDVVLSEGDIASTTQFGSQTMTSNTPGDRSTSIVLSGAAFSNNSGLVSINLTAGQQNQSANLAALAIGNFGAVSDQLLEQSRAPIEPSGRSVSDAGERNDTIAVSDGAFGDSSGLIQINLIGGERNSSANTFSLTVLAGGQP